LPSYFTLVLDTRPPASPTLLLNGGASHAGVREVVAVLGAADLALPTHDVTAMKLWGDVDPAADPSVQPLEGASSWVAFVGEYALRLSTGDGRKTIYARLRDDVLNPTLAFSDFIDYDASLPVVAVTSPLDRGRISKVALADAATFGWQCSADFTAYEVRAVPSVGSPQGAGVVIPTAGGSVNVAGTGAFPAGTTISTTIRGADLEAASPGDGPKFVKVFARSGAWSP